MRVSARTKRLCLTVLLFLLYQGLALSPRIPGPPVAEAAGTMSDLTSGLADGLASGFNTWAGSLYLDSITLNGPSGIMTGSGLKSRSDIKTCFSATLPVGSGRAVRLQYAIGQAIGQAVENWQLEYTGLVLTYPNAAAFPGPLYPPTPNIAAPLAGASHCPSLGPFDQTTFESALGHTPDEAESRVWDKARQGFKTAFNTWKTTAMITNVLGQGPIPTFAPPYVPVGPVVGGTASGGGVSGSMSGATIDLAFTGVFTGLTDVGFDQPNCSAAALSGAVEPDYISLSLAILNRGPQSLSPQDGQIKVTMNGRNSALNELTPYSTYSFSTGISDNLGLFKNGVLDAVIRAELTLNNLTDLTPDDNVVEFVVPLNTRPDLAMEDFEVFSLAGAEESPADQGLVPGADAKVSFTVMNPGTANANSSYYEIYYLPPGAVLGAMKGSGDPGGTHLAHHNIDPLYVQNLVGYQKTEAVITEDISLPASIETGGYIAVRVIHYDYQDHEGRLKEESGDRENNYAVFQISVLLTPAIRIEPAALDFGQQLPGGTARLSLTIFNDGQANLPITGLSGLAGTAFSLIDPPAVPLTIPPGGSRPLTVGFNPPSSTQSAATLIISNPASEGGKAEVPITGSVLAPELSFQLADMDFGQVQVGSSKNMSNALINASGTDIIVNSLGGLSETDFGLVDQPGTPFVVGPGQSQPLNVTFGPTSSGQKSAVLTVVTGFPVGQVLTATLTGEGVEPGGQETSTALEQPMLLVMHAARKTAEPTVGQPVVIEVEVANEGANFSADPEVEFHLDGSVLSTGKMGGGFKPGQKRKKTFRFTPTRPGDYVLAFKVDPKNTITGPDEARKMKTLTVHVTDGPVQESGQQSAGAMTLQQWADQYARENKQRMDQYDGKHTVQATARVAGPTGKIEMKAVTEKKVTRGKKRGRTAVTEMIQVISFRKKDAAGPDRMDNWQQVSFENKPISTTYR